MLNIIKQSDLSQKQLYDFHHLEEIHNSIFNDNYHIIYEEEWDEDDTWDIYFLFKYSENTLISVLSYFDCGDYIELSGLTHPDFRNMGYFKELLDLSNIKKRNVPLIYTLSQYMDSSCHTFYKSEYLLELTKENHTLHKIEKCFCLVHFKDDMWLFKRDNNIIGSICLFIDEASTFAYDVFINEEHRGNGYGRILMELAYDKSDKCKSFCLHVSSTNSLACRIYFKMGFHIRESIDYYQL